MTRTFFLTNPNRSKKSDLRVMKLLQKGTIFQPSTSNFKFKPLSKGGRVSKSGFIETPKQLQSVIDAERKHIAKITRLENRHFSKGGTRF